MFISCIRVQLLHLLCACPRLTLLFSPSVSYPWEALEHKQKRDEPFSAKMYFSILQMMISPMRILTRQAKESTPWGRGSLQEREKLTVLLVELVVLLLTRR